ncbi:MAG: DUF116 domain-containing protein, partial [Acidobacteriota bacterium]
MKQSPANFPGASLKRSERTILVSLLAITAVLAVVVLAALFAFPYYGFSRIHPGLPGLAGLLTVLSGVGVVGGFGLLIAVIMIGHDVPCSRKLRSISLKGLLPVLTLVGRLVGLRKEEVQHAFVAVNNELVLAQCRSGRPPRSILLLMPHCLQDKDCPIKITNRVENCKRCGKCRIKDLLEVSEKYGVDLAVATGGTIARRIVIEKRPDLIIAV